MDRDRPSIPNWYNFPEYAILICSPIYQQIALQYPLYSDLMSTGRSRMLNRKDDARALHVQLTQYYRERILDGRLPPGTRLPTELMLVQEHHLSRDTIRQALAQLVNEGLLERVPGRGTFVHQPPTQLPSEEISPIPQRRIGIVLNQPPGTQLNADILVGIEQVAKSHNYHVSFTFADESQLQQDHDITRLLDDQVAGLIIFPASNTVHDEHLAQLRATNFPFVLIDRYLPDLETDYVGPDNQNGAYQATQHLLILGYRRIGFVCHHIETLLTSSVHDRWLGYRQALNRYDVSYDERLFLPPTPVSPSATSQTYLDLLLSPDRPDAIFAVNDLAALELLQIARSCGLRIPEDLALVGFDDLSFAAHLSPALTTVALPRLEVGLHAANLLFSRIDAPTSQVKHLALPTRLIIRESCGTALHIKKFSH